MTDQQILSGAGPTPVAITLDVAQRLLPKLAFAAFDGTGAAGAFLPVVKFVGPGGLVAGQAVGDVVAAGASVDQTWFRGLAKQASAGGAITATTEIARSSFAINVPGNGTGGNLIRWMHGSGPTLLNYTTDTAPKIITAGIYAISVNVIMATATFVQPSVMAITFQAGPTVFLKGVCPLATNVFGGGGAVDTPEVVLTTPPLNLAAGAALSIDVRQGSGGNLSFSLQGPVGAVITKLG